MTSKEWKITARYSHGGYWGDIVFGETHAEAISTAREIMAENGDTDPASIEIVDCDEMTPDMRARDEGPALLAAARECLARWERGNLAEAMRALQGAVDSCCPETATARKEG